MFFFLFTWKYNKSNEASWVEIDWYRVGAVKHTKAVALTWFNDQFSLLVLLLHRSQTHCIFSHVWFSSLYILYTHSYNYCGANYIHWMLKCWYGSLEKSGTRNAACNSNHVTCALSYVIIAWIPCAEFPYFHPFPLLSRLSFTSLHPDPLYIPSFLPSSSGCIS